MHTDFDKVVDSLVVMVAVCWEGARGGVFEGGLLEMARTRSSDYHRRRNYNDTGSFDNIS